MKLDLGHWRRTLKSNGRDGHAGQRLLCRLDSRGDLQLRLDALAASAKLIVFNGKTQPEEVSVNIMGTVRKHIIQAVPMPSQS